jgi:hypothetical protein
MFNWYNYSTLNSAYTFNSPHGSDYSNIVIEGYFTPKETGNYTFYTQSDDASLIMFNGASLGRYGTVSLVAGRTYPFSVRQQEYGGGESLWFRYLKPSNQSTWTLDWDELLNTSGNISTASRYLRYK